VSIPISIVIPSLADRELLSLSLTPLLAELERRDAGDEVIVVDDSGAGALEDWLAAHFPAVRVLCNARNLGFARALLAGVEAARHEHVFAMNPDVRIQPGLFEPLLESLADDVWAVSPYVLLDGERPDGESLAELVVEDGFPVLRHQQLEVVPGQVHPDFPEGIPVAFALGGAMLLRRADFLAAPFDPRYEPFYWEDVDWAQRALRRGRRVLVDPRAVAHHHHRGTIQPRIPERLVRAAIEKNRLLYAWGHLEGDDLRAHLEALTGRLVEHTVCEDREELLWLLLALEQQLDPQGSA
jgi:GT2 family glycosyltransferase